MKAVSVFFDVEDPINLEADQAALELARLVSERGVRGSFCVTGEKCRSLVARRRYDVVDALSVHCLGLHTDKHSQHPTTMELLASLDYETGCRAALEAERRGFEAFTQCFGRNPSFWGGAGNTWSPEIAYAVQTLGIAATVYALTEVASGVHQFGGVLCFPQDFAISELDWADDCRAQSAAEGVFNGINASRRPWLGVFIGHPTKFRHCEFWDKSYSGGRTPTEPEFVERLPDDVYAKSLANVATFLSRLGRDYVVIGLDDAARLSWSFRELTETERSQFNESTAANIRSAGRWPIHRPDLDVEPIVVKTLAMADSVRAAEFEA